MAKPPSKDLFLLIKSLNKSEKGYIRKFAFTHDGEDANFIRLFKAIDNQVDYDENALLKTEEYINQLPRMKIYLFEFILDTLANYYANKNSHLQIRQLINRIAILFEKGFYDSCIRQLVKAKELSKKFEYFTIYLDTLQWERVLMMEKQMLSDFSSIEEEEQKTFMQLEEILRYNSTYRKVSELYTEVIYIRTKEEDQKFRALLPAKYFSTEKNATSFQAKILLLKSKAKHLSASGDMENYLLIARRTVALMESHPHFIVQDMLQYIKALNNLVVALSETSRIKEFETALSKLMKLPQQYEVAATDRFKSLIRMRVVTRLFYHYKFHNEFEKAAMIIPEFKIRIEESKRITSKMHRSIFLYGIAYIQYITNEYKTSLASLNILMEETGKNELKFFNVYSRILRILIHYELKNTDLVESIIRSTLRFLEHEPGFMLEKEFLRFVDRKLIKSPSVNRADLRAFLLKAESRVKAEDHIILEYFDYIAWIKSKINNISFQHQLLQDKGKK